MIKIVTNSINKEIKVGDIVWCFDPDLYENDIITPPSITVRKGKVVKIYKNKGRNVADIDFNHKDKISRSHFVSGLRLYG